MVKCANGYGPLLEAYQDLVVWRDKQVGTPCEQIRHQQLVAELVEALKWCVADLEVENSNLGIKKSKIVDAAKAALKKAGAE